MEFAMAVKYGIPARLLEWGVRLAGVSVERVFANMDGSACLSGGHMRCGLYGERTTAAVCGLKESLSCQVNGRTGMDWKMQPRMTGRCSRDA